MTDSKHAWRHWKKCKEESLSSWVYCFAKIDGLDDPYFCYFGCKDTYSSRDGIAKHLFDEHKDDLWKWGICHVRLQAKYKLVPKGCKFPAKKILEPMPPLEIST